MGNLTGALGAATRTLASFSEALSVIQNNIGNAATPNYARQRVSLAPLGTPDGASQSLGVEVTRVQSLRDRLLDFQVLLAKQATSLFEKKTLTLQQVEPLFRLTGAGSLGANLDEFFASISALSVSPADVSLRRSVLSAADQLTRTFRSTVSGLSRSLSDLDTDARSTVAHINSLLEQVAELSSRRTSPDAKSPNFAAETRLHQTLDELAQLIDFTVIEQSDGTLSLLGGGGTPLVVGQTTMPLTASLASNGIKILDSRGADITASLESQGGALGAILEARNQTLPGYLSQVNRLAKSIADQVNEQLARGVDLLGAPGKDLFAYTTSFVLGSGRTAGTTGSATPSPPVSVQVNFSNGVTGSVTANLDSFFVATAAPSGPVAGETVSVTFTSADGTITRTITTAPLLAGGSAAQTTAEIRDRLNDQIALDPDLAGLITFSDTGTGPPANALKVVLSDQAGQAFSFTATTSNPAFTTGLEGGGTLGGHSAEEIAAALNAQVVLDSSLSAAGIRFAAVGGQVKIDGDASFDFTVSENAQGTAFASGLPATGTAGGADAAATIAVASLTPAEIAAGTASSPLGSGNALALEALASTPVIDSSTFSQFYASLVQEVGDDIRGSTASLETQEQILLTAENLRDSFSGVDINEEAVQLLQFQRSFQAILRVIQVVDTLLGDVLRLVR